VPLQVRITGRSVPLVSRQPVPPSIPRRSPADHDPCNHRPLGAYEVREGFVLLDRASAQAEIDRF
jgi:hypothetical protein